MDIEEHELDMSQEEHVDNRLSNNLDLNVEHDCRNPKLTILNGSSRYALRLGIEFESDEQAYRFYNRYAELVGFSVRKDWVNRSKVHGRVMSRKFTCSRQGHRKKDKRDVNVKKHRKETRTGCLAYMVVTRLSSGKYVVTQFEAEHNHEDVDLSKAEKFLELPLSGKGSSTEVFEVDSEKKLDLHSKVSYQFLGVQFGPAENSMDPQINDELFLSCGRTRDMKDGDAARLMYYFNRQHFFNPSLFYSVQLDIDDKVSNIFWADDQMIVEYSYFGDVVCLDTSCRRSTNSRPYVQFIGLNSHRQVVVFAAAFLYDDSVDSFKWLVRTFVEGMSGKKPKVILSDQDATVVQAIHTVLPETSHCICVWQIYLIALKHLRHLVKEYDLFADDFRTCIFGHEEEEDFIQAWNFMLERHGLHNNAWLRWMFTEKEKWAVVYGRNTFFIERNGTHLVELFSDKLKPYLGPSIDLLQFFKHFESVINEQRYRELEFTVEMGRDAPILMASAILLKHPSEAYAPEAFELFQREYEKSLNVVIHKCGQRDSRLDFKARTYGKSRDFLVTYNSLDGSVSCNCKKFEHVGFLCSHALKVFDHQNVKVVPPCYILKRWTKDARFSPDQGSHCCSEADNEKIVTSRYRDLCRSIVKISARAAQSDAAFAFAAKQLDQVMQGVERILNFKSLEEAKGASAADNADNDVDHEKHDFEGEGAECLREAGVIGSIVPHKVQVDHCDEQGPCKSGCQNDRPSPPEIIVSLSCAPPTFASTPSLSPLARGLYTTEGNHVVQSMYQASNLTINQQPIPDMYESPNFYSNQHHSQGHPHLLQEAIIHSQFGDRSPNGSSEAGN